MSVDKAKGVRGSWVYDHKLRKLVPKKVRPKIETHSVIVDGFFEADLRGVRHTSKRKFDEHRKSLGLEYCYGESDKHFEREKRPEDTDEYWEGLTERAYYLLRDGEAPLSEEQMAICKRNNELMMKRD